MTPTLIGYFPKRTLQRPDWLNAAGVNEICSASNCISQGPEGWIERWQHNEMWVYDTVELAWGVVPDAIRGEFDLYAYKMFPVQFAEGQQRPFEFPPLQVAPLPPSFERLGFDIVSRSYGNAFECSPLSCNHMAEHIAVTHQCLVADKDLACQLAAEFEAGGCEPGPYFVVEVWRQKNDAATCSAAKVSHRQIPP
jgi:hypothetical protein